MLGAALAGSAAEADPVVRDVLWPMQDASMQRYGPNGGFSGRQRVAIGRGLPYR